MSEHRIALIHATSVAIAPVAEAFQRLWPEAAVSNLLDDSLSADLARDGRLTEDMVERFHTLGDYVSDCGADGILFTCSAFGRAIEAVAARQAPVPVLKPNEAMFEDALEAGSLIGLVATFEASVGSMTREFESMAEDAGVAARLESRCVPDAMAALAAGDAATHNRLVAEAASELSHCEAVMLAQFSTAQALEAVSTRLSRPVLTSPDSAVRKLRAVI